MTITVPDDYRDMEPSSEITQLLEIMRRLRDPNGGCPWDLNQTFTSIIPYTIEEAYEVKDAIERDDMVELCDELGDLLLQVVYHAEIAKERGAFDFADVVQSINRKMLRRHPHVFGSEAHRKAGLKAGEWERIKAEERTEKAALKADRQTPKTPRLLDDVPNTLPALNRALKLQKRAASVGFDWNDINLVFDKLREEFTELEAECAKAKHDNGLVDEMGDIFFVAVNLARHLKIDPEIALNSTNSKFTRRFNHIEETLRHQGLLLEDADLEQMEALWQESKNI